MHIEAGLTESQRTMMVCFITDMCVYIVLIIDG